MTGADHLQEAIATAELAAEPFKGNPTPYLTAKLNTISTFCLHRASVLIQRNAFDVANDLIVLASQYVLGLSNELFKDEDVRREGMAALERVYGKPGGDDPLSSSNQLTADELRELGIEV